ncbi:MAG: hypothetical protein KAK01_09685 [Candidatus Marinimicrobia bacterium]|nr:hypothetical protein [Candidatus Neomarinimicrobiota bacterium]
MNRIAIILLTGAILLCADNSKTTTIDLLDMSVVTTIKMEQHQTLDQAIWNGIKQLQTEGVTTENGMVKIILEQGEPIYVIVNLEAVSKVDAGKITLRDYILNFVNFQ